MKANNILADQVQISWPIFCEHALGIGIADTSHIGGQRVDPDIHDMARRSRYRNAPVKTRPRNTEIPKAALDKSHDFVATALGLDKFGMLVVEF